MLHEGDFATSSLEPWSYAHRSQTISVPMATIDTLTADWPRLDLVKIDAEGVEGQVWSGMREARRRFPGVVTVMELLIPRDPAGTERLLNDLADEGVTIQAVEFDGTVRPVTVAEILAEPQRHWTVRLGGS